MGLLQFLGLGGQQGMPMAPAAPPAGLNPGLPNATVVPPRTAGGGLASVIGGGQQGGGHSWHGLGGYLGALLPGIQQFATGLAQTGNVNGAFQAMQQNRNDAFDRQVKLAQLAAKGEQPSTVQELMAAGIQPGTPEFRSAILNHLTAPHYLTLGTPETGQTVVDASGLGGGGDNVPSVSDQASYDAIPSGSRFRDPQGNVRQKP